MQFPVDIGLHRSTLLGVLLVLFHAVAASCIAVLPWLPVWRGLALLPLALSLGLALRPSWIVGLRLAAPDRIECLLADGGRVGARTLADSTVFSRLIVLRLRLGQERRTRSLVVLPDQIGGDDFRVLRLWLRWQAEPKDDAGTAF